MKPTDAYLVAGFLKLEHDRFAEFLERCEIEPTEAGVIIESFKKDFDGHRPPDQIAFRIDMAGVDYAS